MQTKLHSFINLGTEKKNNKIKNKIKKINGADINLVFFFFS